MSLIKINALSDANPQHAGVPFFSLHFAKG